MQNDNAKLKNFAVTEIPRLPSINAVYILCVIKNEKEVPFYVGESGKLRRRVGEYLVASPQASTDFKVGEAIQHFHEKGYKVEVRYLQTTARKSLEKNMIRFLKSKGFRLLNDIPGFDRRTFDLEREHEKIKRFCDDALNFEF